MKILTIALFAASLATTPAAAYADVAPEGHSQAQIASFGQPEGEFYRNGEADELLGSGGSA